MIAIMLPFFFHVAVKTVYNQRPYYLMTYINTCSNTGKTTCFFKGNYTYLSFCWMFCCFFFFLSISLGENCLSAYSTAKSFKICTWNRRENIVYLDNGWLDTPFLMSDTDTATCWYLYQSDTLFPSRAWHFRYFNNWLKVQFVFETQCEGYEMGLRFNTALFDVKF